jgi:hypothetical protein
MMKKLLLLFIVFTACKKEVHYYPSKKYFIEKDLQELNIDNLIFEQITDSIRSGLSNNRNLFINIEDTKGIYKIAPFVVTGGYFREKNILYIINDSIDLAIGRFSMQELSKYIKLHYENNGENYLLASSYKKAQVQLVLSNKEKPKKLKAILLNLMKTYNNTDIKNKDSIAMHIVFDYPINRQQYIPPRPNNLKNN